MENLDANVEQQVWQRVFARPVEPAGEDFRGLQMAAMELAGAYRYLMAMLSGRQKEHVKQLYEGELSNIASLKGMHLLSGRQQEVLKIWNPTKEPPRRLLERCYHRTRGCMVEYMARTADPEFGTVFRKMADREGEHCVTLTELLGSLGQGK